MLSISIDDGDGFTIGPDIVVRVGKGSHGGIQVHIAAPRELQIHRIDQSAAKALSYTRNPGDETPNRTRSEITEGERK